MAWCAAQGAIALEGVEAVIEGVIDLALDEAAAYPQAAGAIVQGPGLDAAGHLLLLHAGLPRFAGVGNNEFTPHDEAVDLQFPLPPGQ